MAAIKPHLAEEDETTPEQAAYWKCTSGGLDGLGRMEPGELCPTPAEVLEQSHSGLLNTAWIRKPLRDQMMQGLVIDVIKKGTKYALRGRFPGEGKKSVEGAAWNPYSATPMGILSWTTKMGAPSFSLPAGTHFMGGSCPGATAGQSIAPPKERSKQAKTLLPILYGPKYDGAGMDLSKAICEYCYAEGGQYATSSVQYAQLLRFAWAKGALQQKAKSGRSMFVEIMIQAIDDADYKLGEEPKQWRHPDGRAKRFFRMHDSGDFFSTTYFDAWKEITDYFHPTYGGKDGNGHPDPIWFWAPTRMWVTQNWVDHINKVNAPRRGHEQNFAVRPSAYHINEHGPLGAKGRGLGRGWAAATVVYDDESKMQAEGDTYDWDCRAYAVEKGPTCRGAASNPLGSGDGKPGCRNCWVLPDQRTNYTLHY